MNQLSTGLSFLSRFDANEFYQIANDLPQNFEMTEEFRDERNLGNNNSMQIIGTHLIVPENSISKMLDDFSVTNLNADFNTAFANIPAIPTSSLTSSQKFLGSYQFRMGISSQDDSQIKKSISWTYSKQLNKLFCIRGVACPIEISVTQTPPVGSIIRACPVFSKPEHAQERVKRCENHKKASLENITDQNCPHFLRCNHNLAWYEQNTTHESVTIPYEKPQIGSEATTVLYQFMCFSSCVGGSKKPVSVVLSLELNGQVLGRDSFEVKICACPGRDRNMEEKKLCKRKSTRNPVAVAVLPETTKKPSFTNKNAIDKVQENDDIYTIRVKGRENYLLLKKIAESLEIQRVYQNMKNLSPQALNNSSALFNGPGAGAGATGVTPTTSKSNDDENSLEGFLQKHEMIAYYNVLVSKGITNLNELLNSTKKIINSLKISQSDTNKLWSEIQKLKTKIENLDNNDLEKVTHANKRPRLESSSLNMNDNRKNDEMVKISKFQIKYSFEMRK
jgi:hypothetical protein